MGIEDHKKIKADKMSLLVKTNLKSVHFQHHNSIRKNEKKMRLRINKILKLKASYIGYWVMESNGNFYISTSD